MKKWLAAGLLPIFVIFLGACSIQPGDVVENKNFKGKDFSAENLSGVSLISSDFSKVNFEYANLENADFTDSIFMKANFNDADLENADLSNADFSGASFVGANLSGADLSDATFKNCDFSDANLQGAILDESNFLGSLGFHGKMIAEAASYTGAEFQTEKEIYDYFSDVCESFEGKPDAKPFSNNDSTHPYVFIESEANDGQYDIRPSSATNSIWDTDTIICEGDFITAQKTCEYNGGYTLERTRKEVTYTFLEAQTGEVITTKAIHAGNSCPFSWEFTINQFHEIDDGNYIFGEEQVEFAIGGFLDQYTE